ncbi:MAG: hypothetical protein ACRDTP_00430 [Mycobacteriales bacterium]
MLVDCGTCTVRGLACGECVVTVLWGLPDDEVGADRAPSAEPGHDAALRLDLDDRAALRALADAGMVPRLRHEGGLDRRVAG